MDRICAQRQESAAAGEAETVQLEGHFSCEDDILRSHRSIFYLFDGSYLCAYLVSENVRQTE